MTGWRSATSPPLPLSFFNLRSSDVGRPLTDLADRLDFPDLEAQVREVFSTGEGFEQRLSAPQGDQHYLVRLMPYRDYGEGIGGVVVTNVDVSSLAHAERQQQMLLAELNGRVRNMLTAAIDMARETRQSAGSIEDFSDRLVGRLRSMAQAYGLLFEAEWTSVSLADLAQAELSRIDPSRLDISGPALELQPRQAVPVGVILRELVSNAARHGALATEEGRISLTWDRAGDRVTLGWHEIGGNGAPDGTVNGYGLDLVATQVEDQLQGKMTTDFSRDGLVFELSFSLER